MRLVERESGRISCSIDRFRSGSGRPISAEIGALNLLARCNPSFDAAVQGADRGETGSLQATGNLYSRVFAWTVAVDDDLSV